MKLLTYANNVAILKLWEYRSHSGERVRVCHVRASAARCAVCRRQRCLGPQALPQESLFA